MSQHYKRIALLLIRWRYGMVSPSERRELEAWASLSPDNQALLDEYMQDEKLMHDVKVYGESDWTEGWIRLQAAIPALQNPRPRRSRVRAVLMKWRLAISSVFTGFSIRRQRDHHL